MTRQARDAGQFIIGLQSCQSTLHMVLYALNSFSISMADNLCSMPNNLPIADVFWWEIPKLLRPLSVLRQDLSA